MGKYRRVWTVYRKELVDTLRDRRTLIAMVVVPVVLYPVLMIVLVEALRTEKGRREAEQYRVCVPDEQHKQWLLGLLQREDDERESIAAANRAAAESTGQAAPDPSADLRAALAAEQVEIAVVGSDQSLWDFVKSKEYHLGILVDPPPSPDDFASYPNRVVQLIYHDTEPRSEFAFHQLRVILSNESERIVRQRLTAVPRGEAVVTPFALNGLTTVGPDRQYAKILAAIVPFLLVIMTVTGAMYPAIDLTAGERERGTLETLAVSPVPVGQIVAGKFGVIVTIALFTTALNLGSMTAMIYFTNLDQLASSAASQGEAQVLAVERMIERASPGDDADSRRLTQRDYLQRRAQLVVDSERAGNSLIAAAPIVLLAMVPFAVLFSAVMLAVCSFARTFKEAQNYMMPVMMCAMIPAMVVSYMPSIRLEGALLVMPVANVVVLLRELFLGNYDASAMVIAILSTSFYAVVSVLVAARLYGSEAVLFTDVGSYKTLLRRRYFKPRPHPSAAGALLLLAIIFPIHFYWQSSMIDLSAGAAHLRMVLVVSQVAILAGPAILLTWYLKADIAETFSLRLPSAAHALGALLIAAGAAPVSFLLHRIQAAIFGQAAPVDAFRDLETLLTSGSTLTVFIVIALLPGICEEFLFRGWLQSSLRGKLSAAKTIIVVGILFGVFHIVVEKIPQVSLMGILLAFVCLRSGSIFLAMFVHIMHNGIPVLASVSGWLGRLYGFPATEADAEAWMSGPLMDPRTAVFLALFAAGIGLIALTRARRRDIGA